MSSVPPVHVAVGNTYQRLSNHHAPYDRSGRIKKVHDWTLYVDVMDGGNPDLIERVTFHLGESFEPSQFTCSSPVPVKKEDGTKVMRFSTRQQTYGPTSAVVKIRGVGGTTKSVERRISFDPDRRPICFFFKETKPLMPLRMVKLPENVKFGLELELTTASHVTVYQVADKLPGVVKVMDTYMQGRQEVVDGWKIVPDGSIVCNRSQPDCNTFELVSPVFQGGPGLSRVATMVNDGLSNAAIPIKVNKSMGFHVHVDVSRYTIAQLVKICQNFIKYEDVLDSFLPASRRTGSPESNQYFQSNRISVGARLSNARRHEALARCTTIDELAGQMNGGAIRYYKLNLQNLCTGRQPTLEFRQHSATANYDKIAAWIRLCVQFCSNSARLGPPSAFSESRSLKKQTEALFYYVIKDRALRDFYLSRQAKLQSSDDDGDDCCDACAR